MKSKVADGLRCREEWIDRAGGQVVALGTDGIREIRDRDGEDVRQGPPQAHHPGPRGRPAKEIVEAVLEEL